MIPGGHVGLFGGCWRHFDCILRLRADRCQRQEQHGQQQWHAPGQQRSVRGSAWQRRRSHRPLAVALHLICPSDQFELMCVHDMFLCSP
jgi:hypothetical protein